MSHASQTESLFESVRRAALDHDERILAILDGDDVLSAEQVHDLRVAIKNLRALWRLSLAGGKKKTVRKRDRTLKKAAAALSDARDSQVMLETLDRLAAASHRPFEQESLAAVRDRLTTDMPATVEPRPPADFAEVFRDDLARWRAMPPCNDAAPLRAGLVALYRHARRRGLEAMAEDDPDSWHRFRNWAKHLQYQLAPLPLGGDELDLKELRKLGQALGNLHDLHVLDAHLKRLGKTGGDREALAAVRQVICRREADLSRDCGKRARRFFALKPKPFRRLLKKALRVDNAEAPPSAPSD